MLSKLLPPGILALAGVGFALGAACGGPTEPHGSPVLTKVYWSANGAQQVVWSPANAPDPTLASSVSPFGNEIDFVFDRQLDGSSLEDIVTMNGTTVAVPKTPAAIEVTWPDMAARMSDPPFKLSVDYNSLPTYGGQSVYVFARPDAPGFPSGETLTFDLILVNLTSAYGDIATAPASIAVKTTTFSVSIQAPTGTAATSFELPLTFANRLPPVPVGGTSPAVHVTAGGAVPYKLVADASLRSRWFLAPADCLGAWPASSTFTVTIDAALADAFGGPLAQGATATFATGAASGITRDAGCAIGDGGADGAPASDAAADAALEAGASEGGADAATTDARDGGVDDAHDGATSDAPASFGDALDDAAIDAADDGATPADPPPRRCRRR